MKILITGAAGGIGSATAEFFLEKGHEVHGLDIAEMPEEYLCKDVFANYVHHIADVTDEDSFPEDIVPEVLINCAGVQDMDNGDRDIEVNLRGTIKITEKYAVSNERIRSVVMVGSASGHTGAEFPMYTASKGGVLAYTRHIALRLAPRATCNSIDPGGVTTELNRCVMDDPVLWNRIMELTPLKRWAEPREIAEWIYFVAVINRFMTGQNLLIDGGEAGNAEFVWPE
jgi:3-oxoacyl-[acyl-carrier protein] reductase